jgi:hypothetical protein
MSWSPCVEFGMPTLAAEFVGEQVAVIVAVGGGLFWGKGGRASGARQITKFYRSREAALLDPEAAVEVLSPWMRCTPPMPEGRGGAAACDAGACATADDVTPCLQRRNKHRRTPELFGSAGACQASFSCMGRARPTPLNRTLAL